MSHYIAVTSEFQDRYLPNSIDGYRVRLTSGGAVNMSAKIFLYQEKPIAPGGTTKECEFITVCGPADLAEYPEDAATAGADPAFFRYNQVDFVFRSKHEADEAVAAVYFEIGKLVETLDIMDKFATPHTVTFGTPP